MPSVTECLSTKEVTTRCRWLLATRLILFTTVVRTKMCHSALLNKFPKSTFFKKNKKKKKILVKKTSFKTKVHIWGPIVYLGRYKLLRKFLHLVGFLVEHHFLQGIIPTLNFLTHCVCKHWASAVSWILGRNIDGLKIIITKQTPFVTMC